MPTLSTIGAACARAWGFTSGLVKDQYFNLVSLLLPGNGTNGAQNNTFLDSGTANSGSGFTITRNGDTTQGTFSPFSQTGWGAYFDGSNDYVATSANNLSMQFGTGSYTVECWIYQTARNSNGAFFIGGSGSIFQVSINATGYLESSLAGVGSFTASTSTVPLNSWTHIALVRSSTSTNGCTYYINGNASGTYTDSNNHSSSTSTINIGTTNAGSSTYVLSGYISNMRIAKSAYYTSNFTPSITPLTTTSQGATNVTLLSLQNNRFIDNAATPNTLTPNNGVAITPFSPFAPTQSYLASAVGGSGYFDGNTDYLSVANQTALQLSGSQFTIEGWFYFTTSGVDNYIVVQSSALADANVNWLVRVTSGNKLRVLLMTSGATAVSFDGSTTVTANSWHHFAATCDGTGAGSNVRSWLDGVYQGGTTVNTANINTNSAATQIGGWSFASSYSTGYVSGLRILKGTALYTGTSDITVPTSPPTAITNTSLLLNFTNAGVVDATAKNVLETVGNAQISTTQSKWGGGSIYFDGTGDWLTVPKAGNWSIGSSEPFTIEAWVYLTAAQANYRALLSDYNSGSPGSSKYLFINSSGIEFQLGTTAGTVASCTQSFSQNQWYYIAITRNSSNVISMYVDGVSKTVSQATQSGAFLDVGSIFYVGRWGGTTAYEWYGYIDDLRITKGVARTITASPTAPFPVQ